MVTYGIAPKRFYAASQPFNLEIITISSDFVFVCSASGGREGGGSRAVCHEDQENSEGTRQQGSVYGLV